MFIMTANLLAHCDLPWDDRCLTFHETERPVKTASHAQVRQPLYRDAIGAEVVEKLRGELGLKSLADEKRAPLYIKAAEQLGLGIAERSRIVLREVTA